MYDTVEYIALMQVFLQDIFLRIDAKHPPYIKAKHGGKNNGLHVHKCQFENLRQKTLPAKVNRYCMLQAVY